MANNHSDITNTVRDYSEILQSVRRELGKRLIGQEELVERLLISLLTKGHILLEGVPGLAKTTAISALAEVCDLTFARIQFTPDLLPADITGSLVYNPKTMEYSTKKGPVFHNFILADEINRSPAKVQSALLEAMQERQVTIGEESHRLPDPFFVMATQNPLEQEGTYPLPEAQVDRFLLKTVITYPTYEEELRIMEQATYPPASIETVLDENTLRHMQEAVGDIYIDDTVLGYIADIVFASRSRDSFPNIAYGASPRGSIGLVLASKALALLQGHVYVTPDQVKQIAPDVLRHRLIGTYEAQAEGIDSDALVQQLLEKVRVP